MPTGYTAKIEDDTIKTGKDFLLLCSRAFGVQLEIKDKPLTLDNVLTKFEPDPYYQKKYDSAVEELNRYSIMPLDEFRELIINRHNKEIKSITKRMAEMKEINERYSAIREQIEKWNPPTESHMNIKKFAIEQIDMCVFTDEDFKIYQQILNTPFEDSEEFILNRYNEQLKMLKENVDRAAQTLQEEVYRVENNNEYMKQLIESLKRL